MFADDVGQLWSAAFTERAAEWAVVFACVTDARQPIRALALGKEDRPAALTEEVLRGWLVRAPRLGPLT